MIAHQCGGANASMEGANRIVAAPEVIFLSQQYDALKFSWRKMDDPQLTGRRRG